MDLKALVSVIIPTYNRASMLRRAVDSVLSQDYANLELVVVDDGSTDTTEDIMRAVTDPRVRYIRRNRPSGGAALPRNVGLREAKGAYIAFLDSDDEFFPGRISRQMAAFERVKPETDLMFVNYMEVGDQRHPHIGIDVKSGYLDTSRFPASLFCAPSAWMITRRCLEQVGFFDEDLWMVEDADYIARAVRCCPVYFLNEVLANIHVHNTPGGHSPVAYSIAATDRYLAKWSADIRRDKTYAGDFYCKMTKDLLRTGERSRARDCAREAFAVNPLSSRVWRMMIKAFAAPRKILHMCLVLTLVLTLGCAAVRKTKRVYHEAVSKGKTAVKVALLAVILH